MAKLYNLARMTTATTGTGTITLGSAVASYVTFATAGVQNGDTVTYAIVDGNNREVGRGVYTSSGTTLTRATILESTNSNLAINLSGSAEVFITAAAEDIANVGEANTFSATQTFSASVNISGAIKENVFTITDGASVDLNPANGTVQLWTLGASRSPTATNFLAGQSMTLMIDDGTSFSITWPSVTWVNNGKIAPTLATTGYTVVVLWKAGSVLYGALVGDGR